MSLKELDHVAAVMETRPRAGQQHDVPRVVLAVQEGADDPLRGLDVKVVGNPESECHVEFGGGEHVRHQHLVVVHPQRTRPAVGVGWRVCMRGPRLHRGDELDRRAGRIVEVQRAALVRHCRRTRP